MPRGEDETVDLDGVRLRCRLDGPVGAPWLVFSNSLMTDLTLWDEQVAAFGAEFRILRYDQRGHGGSSVPAQDCTFADLTGDLVRLFGAFRISSASVVGISMGGVTALGLAANRPALVDRLAVCDCASASTPAGRTAWDERIAVVAAGGMADLVEPTVARWFTPSTLVAVAPATDHVRRMIAGTSADGFVRAARALQSYDLREAPAAIRCPAAFIVGEADAALPEAMRAMAAAAPGATLAVIPEAGHLPNLEQPAAFEAALAALLARPVRSA